MSSVGAVIAVEGSITAGDERRRRMTKELVRRAEGFLLAFQAVGLFTTSYTDKLTPEGEHLLYAVAVAHVIAAVVAFFRGGPFYHGGFWMWTWIGVALLMPMVMAGLLPIGDYGAYQGCVQLCGYPVPPIMFLAFFPWLGARDSLRSLLGLGVVALITFVPLALMVAMYQTLSRDNTQAWLNSVVASLTAYFGGLIFGAICRSAAQAQRDAQVVAYGELFDLLHDNVQTSLQVASALSVRGDTAGIERQLGNLMDSVQSERERLSVAQKTVSLAQLISSNIAQVEGLFDQVAVPAVGGLTLRQPVGLFVNGALGALMKNVVVHARATELGLAARVIDRRLLVIEVRDNGIGFDPEVIEDARHSLHRLRNRARALDGDLERYDAMAASTRIRFWLPLHDDR
ncbi:hypothetical protein AB0P21_23505 [Kribbella sp. NPDC056861]|uniref:hypothetical protein n=1 Tax=Kribbella sp. NPDC056861 TaxID=3154857 RepID=UPI00342BA174